MRLYAWIGEDELGSGRIGLKQAWMPAGIIPLVALEREKIDRPEVREQLQLQASRFGVTIRLVVFDLGEELATLSPRRS